MVRSILSSLILSALKIIAFWKGSTHLLCDLRIINKHLRGKQFELDRGELTNFCFVVVMKMTKTRTGRI